MAIKQWAKPLGLNDPSGSQGPSSFSSYCLTMMTIGLFQNWGLLPNLQKNISNFDNYRVRGNIFWLRGKTERPRIRCDARFEEMPGWRPENEMSVEDALLRWFKYWADEHRYKTDKLSVRQGGIVPRVHQIQPPKKSQPAGVAGPSISEDINETEPLTGLVINEMTPDISVTGSVNELSHHNNADTSQSEAEPITWRMNALVVADPFIPTKNLASAVPRAQINKFREACRVTAETLRRGLGLESVPTPQVVQPTPARRRRARPRRAKAKANGTTQNVGEQTPAKKPTQTLVEKKAQPRIVTHRPPPPLQSAPSTTATTNQTQTTSPTSSTLRPAPKPKLGRQTQSGNSQPSQAKKRKDRKRRARGANSPTSPPTLATATN